VVETADKVLHFGRIVTAISGRYAQTMPSIFRQYEICRCAEHRTASGLKVDIINPMGWARGCTARYGGPR
jgi:hypothetical protein